MAKAPAPKRHRLVQKLVQHARQAFSQTSGRSLADLSHCMAALGVDEHGFCAAGGPRLVHSIERRLAGINRALLMAFRSRSGAVQPETACVLLINLVARIAEANRIDFEVLTELAVAKLVPLHEQADGDVVALARELAEARRHVVEER